MSFELGQIVSGAPVVGPFPVPRESWCEGLFCVFIEAIAEKHGRGAGILDGTPNFSNDFFAVRPFYWGHGGEGEGVLPNFEVPSMGFTLSWYKYPMRGAYSSEPLTPQRWNQIIKACMDSLDNG